MALAGTPDLREVEAQASTGEPEAQLALAVHVHRLITSIAAMAAAAGGMDALAFTGGVDEHSAIVRRQAAGRLAWLGVAIEPGRNDGADGDADLTRDGATVSTLAITAREDLQMAREIRQLLG